MERNIIALLLGFIGGVLAVLGYGTKLQRERDFREACMREELRRKNTEAFELWEYGSRPVPLVEYRSPFKNRGWH